MVAFPHAAGRIWSGFWAWYERNYVLNVALASPLFLLQLAHLTWLGADPIATRLTDHSLFSLDGLLQYLIWFVDYSEIPALVAVSLALRQRAAPRLLLEGATCSCLFLNSPVAAHLLDH